MEQEEKQLQDMSSNEHVNEKKQWQEQNKDFLAMEKQQRFNRLQFLLQRAGIYSNWLAEKLQERQQTLLRSEETASKNQDSGSAIIDDAAKNDALLSNNSSLSTADPATVSSSSLIAHTPDLSQQITRRRSKRASATSKSAVESTSSSGNPVASAKRKQNTIGTAFSNSSGDNKKVKTNDDVGANAAFKILLAERLAGKKIERQPAFVTGCTMREYQLVGLEWLVSLYENGLNGILADEMGLGKTLQTISFIAHLREKFIWGPFLIVGPLSTLTNWVSEFNRFCPDIPVILYHGNQDERARIRNHKLNRTGWSFPVVVTSYEICMNDRKHLSFNWKYIVVDEGHRIKNLNCKLIRELKSYSSANRLLLTGTPLQNNLSELWSLLNFLMPDIFDDMDVFAEWFDFSDNLKEKEGDGKQLLEDESSSSVIHNLHNILKPFLLRRVKTEVEIDIPKKKELLVHCPMMPKQRELYEAALSGIGGLRQALSSSSGHKGEEQPQAHDDENSGASANGVVKRVSKHQSYQDISDLEFDDLIENGIDGSVGQVSIYERKKKGNTGAAVNNVDDGKTRELGDLKRSRRSIFSPVFVLLFSYSEKDDNNSKNSISNNADGKIVDMADIIKWSGKMVILERMIPELFKKGHKVLIFSQMTRMLDILADWCEFVKGWKFCRIDGQVHIDIRREQIKAFDSDPECRLFLLSTRAGGLGINLTAADTVIIFDSDWNPQMDLQAQDRVHRIGQTKPVIVYRLVTRDTVESMILEKAAVKRKFEKLVIHQDQFKGDSNYYQRETTRIEAKDLLKIFDGEEGVKEEGTVKKGFEAVDYSNTLRDIMDDQELDSLLDRSDEAMNDGGSVI